MHPGTEDHSAGLLAQFLGWIAARPRSYAETMEAWRTSCPRISVWEDAVLAGLVTAEVTAPGAQSGVRVVLTPAGRERLGPVPAAGQGAPGTPGLRAGARSSPAMGGEGGIVG